MEKNGIQITRGIMMLIEVSSIKNVMYLRKIIFGILFHVVLKMENIYQVLRLI